MNRQHFPKRANFEPVRVAARISKHLDKPGFDEGIKLDKLSFCLLDLGRNHFELLDNCLLLLDGRNGDFHSTQDSQIYIVLRNAAPG